MGKLDIVFEEKGKTLDTAVEEKKAQKPKLPLVEEHKLEGYIERTYNWVKDDEVKDEEGNVTKPEVRTSYTIQEPIAFWWAEGHSTHRVVDSNNRVHIVPAPGFQGCAMSYSKKDGYPLVQF